MPSVRLVEVDLAARGVQLPRARVGMVLAQPFLSLTPHEPFRWKTPEKSQQLRTVAATLQVACSASHGADVTHFTVFPEYSIPGSAGIQVIDDRLRRDSWPTQTIVIGGTDGLSPEEYAALAAEPGTNVADPGTPAQVPGDQWVNCGIVWVKAADGRVERWLQPKLSPAWEEQDIVNRDMYRGNSIFAFTGDYDDRSKYRFALLVCFDWIARLDQGKPCQIIIDHLSEQATTIGADLSLSWLFVIQHNPYPSHPSFLTSVNEFFDHRNVSNVRRDRTCLVFVNSAGCPSPGKVEKYGNTSVVFPRQTQFTMPTCYGTFRDGARQMPRRAAIGKHKDFVFREGGACIHSFAQVDPDMVGLGRSDNQLALENPHVHPVGISTDPRTPAAIVPAGIKWLNDELDTMTSLAVRYPNVSLALHAEKAQQSVTVALRALPGDSVDRTVTLAAGPSDSAMSEDGPPMRPHADEWGERERDALCHLMDTVGILTICTDDCTVSGAEVHASVRVNGLAFDLVAIRGDTHQRCLEHYDQAAPNGQQPVLLVSRDADNTDWIPRYGSYLETRDAQSEPERAFTDPDGVFRHLGYSRLLKIFGESDTPEFAKVQINDSIHD